MPLKLSEKFIFFGKKYLNSKTTPIPCGSRFFSWSIVHKSNWNDLRMSVSASNMHDFWIKSALFHQRSKKSLLENFREEKTLQSILSSETLIIYNKKRYGLSSEGKYTTPTIKALKTRYIALKKRYKKRRLKRRLFSYSLFLFSTRPRISVVQGSKVSFYSQDCSSPARLFSCLILIY